MRSIYADVYILGLFVRIIYVSQFCFVDDVVKIVADFIELVLINKIRFYNILWKW